MTENAKMETAAENGDTGKEVTPRRKLLADFFSTPRRVFNLYRSLFPEDEAADIKDLRIEYASQSVSPGYNHDVVFTMRDKFVVVSEAGNSILGNHLLRMFLFYGLKLEDYLNFNGPERIRLPAPKFFILYTGPEKELEAARKNAVRCDGPNISTKAEVVHGAPAGELLSEYLEFAKDLRSAVEGAASACEKAEILNAAVKSRQTGTSEFSCYLRDYEEEILGILRQEFLR